MFENYDWVFEDAFNDISEKATSTQSHRCENEEEMSSAKRRKMDDYKASSFTGNIVDITNNNPSYNSKSNVSRGNLLLGIFQENTYQKIFDNENRYTKEIDKPKRDNTKEIDKHSSYIPKEVRYPQSFKKNTTLSLPLYKESNEKSRIKSANRVELGKEVKLIRIFPGPAGLVKQEKNDDISMTSYLNSMKESEDKTVTKPIETNFSKSQDEKNLFSEKAWKLLLNDLPNNFLNEHGISTVKNKANASHRDSMKVQFIAGILDYVDHTHDDPFIILKDTTGNIEGTVHREIPLNYPGVLEPNMVILLHNVGLLKTTTYVMTNKYHILVSRVNLLAVYSSDGHIIRMPHMKNIFSNISNIELARDYCTMPVSRHYMVSNDFNKQQRLDDNCGNTVLSPHSSFNIPSDDMGSVNDSLLNQPNVMHKSNKQNLTDDSKNFKATNKTFESLEHSVDTDDDMNVSFTIESEIISDEQKFRNRLPSQTRDTNYLENTRGESIVNSKNEIKEQNTSRTLQNCFDDTIKINDLQSEDKICEARSVYSCEKSLSYNVITREARENSNLSTKPASAVIKCNAKSSKSLVSYFTESSTHRNNEYDSDDEILSQLDVDSIFNDHRKEC